MRKKFLDYICCPACGNNAFEANSFSVEGEHTLEGILSCRGCLRVFPIINGIPRMLPDSLMNKMMGYHPGFIHKYPDAGKQICNALRNDQGVLNDIVDSRTLDSFSFQWRVFGKVYDIHESGFIDYIKPLDKASFKDKIVLDAGCGFGRHAFFSNKYGAEVVAFDLSEAVESAYKNTKMKENVHVVQGDIYNPPFRTGIFDIVYSIGVLHHLPDTEKGFRSLTRFVKPGGLMFVWIYGRRSGSSETITVFLRRFTTRMDYRALFLLCLVIASVIRLFSNSISYILDGVRLKALADKLPFSNYRFHPFMSMLGDVFDRLSVPSVKYYDGEEIEGWFNRTGFSDIKILRRFLNNESWRGIGRKA